MAEVITKGRTTRPWGIDLKCPNCDCVARFGAGDVQFDGIARSLLLGIDQDGDE